LAEAIRFLERREHGELLASAVGPSFPLKAVNEAVNEARQGESLRVAILPA
jgi:Zn-dependent alcohol dehydrogenase